MMSLESKEQFSQQELRHIEKELALYASLESKKLGLSRDTWVEQVQGDFTQDQRAHTTLMISGMTMAHDQLCAAALRGLGYNVQALDCPDNSALQFGKEFGNRGQCNPTYFTVGNLVKYLTYLRDEVGLSVEEINKKYIFLTAGACGPCRFGMYVTEYRKALQDAGFDGFRVLLFQQQQGLQQATGSESGLQINAKFFTHVLKAMIAGDVVNLLGYRMRPYELEKGATDKALEQCKEILSVALEKNSSMLKALFNCRGIMNKVSIDRSVPKPVVSIVGEFWAMTTEGDGNYHLQRFLEQEGAEVDIQGITNWILFLLWEVSYDTQLRMTLKQNDGRRKRFGRLPDLWKLIKLEAAKLFVKGEFQVYANIIGLHRYHLPDMKHIANLASNYYDVNVRGGEGHMEVGKLIHFIEDQVNHMTVSVKPFGCMPSSGVSDGVMSYVTAKWPGTIFIPIETTGDGEVNIHSRIQMMLLKAREKANAEFKQALNECGMDVQSFRQKIRSDKRWRSPFRRPPHRKAGIATNLVFALAKGERASH